MINYESIERRSRNEDGMIEITIVYKLGFFRWLFRRQKKTETYVSWGGCIWYNKHKKHDSEVDVLTDLHVLLNTTNMS